jgi:hypothetical protein
MGAADSNAATETANRRLLAACAEALPHLPELAKITGAPLDTGAAYKHIDPVHQPVIDKFDLAKATTTDQFRPLVDLIAKLAPDLCWIRSYKPEDGADPHFLDNYGYINIISPSGPFIEHDRRFMIGFWGLDLTYPEHWHEPEEVYALIAGDAIFRSSGQPARRVGPGDCIVHASNQLHATDMTPGPMLALITWKGGPLMKRASIDDKMWETQ